MGGQGRTDRRRRRRHRAVGQMRGGPGGVDPDRDLQFRPLTGWPAAVSLAGLMPYGDANAIVLEMAGEVLPGRDPDARAPPASTAPIPSATWTSSSIS